MSVFIFSWTMAKEKLIINASTPTFVCNSGSCEFVSHTRKYVTYLYYLFGEDVTVNVTDFEFSSYSRK